MKVQNGNIRLQKFQFNPQAILGRGATGNVYKGYRLKDGYRVAIKAIQMSKICNLVTSYLLQGEKTAMRTIKSPYVVQAYEIVQTKDYCYIVMEICSGGSLKDYINKKGKLHQRQAIEIFRKILDGYIAIKQNKIIHRDLKSANIMLKNNQDPVIIDFGYCEMILGKRPGVHYNVGSPSYMSPQAFTKTMYSEKSDIWALGVILYEMLNGVTLDQGKQSKIYFEELKKAKIANYNAEQLSPLIKDIFEKVFITNPLQRATALKVKYIIDKEMLVKRIPIPLTVQGKQNGMQSRLKKMTSLNIQFSSIKTQNEEASPKLLSKNGSQLFKVNNQIKRGSYQQVSSPLKATQNAKSHQIVHINNPIHTDSKIIENRVVHQIKPTEIGINASKKPQNNIITKQKSYQLPKIDFCSTPINIDKKQGKIEYLQQVITPYRIVPMQKQIKLKIIGSPQQRISFSHGNNVEQDSPIAFKRLSGAYKVQNSKLERINSQKGYKQIISFK